MNYYIHNVLFTFLQKKKTNPDEHNNEIQLHNVNNNLLSTQAIDKIPRHIKLMESQVEAIKQRS